jgi:hypothetical protein
MRSFSVTRRNASEEIKRLVQRTYEPTYFLANVARLESISDPFNGTVTYHDSCSGLRELGVEDQPRRVLAKIRASSIEGRLRRRDGNKTRVLHVAEVLAGMSEG